MLLGDKILAVLADGKPHHWKDLMPIIAPSGRKALVNQLSRLRPGLRKQGQDILISKIHGAVYYQQVRLLASAADGHK